MAGMIKTLVTFGIGVYTGIFVAQNYEIQKVDDPQKLWEKFLKYLDEANKQDPDGPKKK